MQHALSSDARGLFVCEAVPTVVPTRVCEYEISCGIGLGETIIRSAKDVIANKMIAGNNLEGRLMNAC